MDMISIDLGKNLAIAFWEDKVLIKIVTLDFFDFRSHVENLFSMFRSISEIVRENRPIIAVEGIGRNNPGMGLQYIQYMDLRFLANKYNCEFYSYNNATIKKTVAGNGRANKIEMLESVLASLYCIIEPKNEHEIDAIACGITHILKGER